MSLIRSCRVSDGACGTDGRSGSVSRFRVMAAAMAAGPGPVQRERPGAEAFRRRNLARRDGRTRIADKGVGPRPVRPGGGRRRRTERWGLPGPLSRRARGEWARDSFTGATREAAFESETGERRPDTPFEPVREAGSAGEPGRRMRAGRSARYGTLHGRGPDMARRRNHPGGGRQCRRIGPGVSTSVCACVRSPRLPRGGGACETGRRPRYAGTVIWRESRLRSETGWNRIDRLLYRPGKPHVGDNRRARGWPRPANRCKMNSCARRLDRGPAGRIRYARPWMLNI